MGVLEETQPSDSDAGMKSRVGCVVGFVVRLRYRIAVAALAVAAAWLALQQQGTLPRDPAGPARETANAVTPETAHETAIPRTSDRADATPLPATPMPAAIPPAVPGVSLAGFLEEHFRSIGRGKKWQGDPAALPPSAPAAEVAALKQFNPEGKQLSLDQERQLQAIIAAYDEQSKPIRAHLRKATMEALARAAAAGQFESVEVGIVPGMDPAALNRAREESGRQVKQVLQRLRERLGRDGIDWYWAVAPSGTLDGIPRQNVVYYLRSREAELFQWRDQDGRLMDERHRAYTEFFERIR